MQHLSLQGPSEVSRCICYITQDAESIYNTGQTSPQAVREYVALYKYE